MSERLFSIAPGQKFLDVLADRILDGTLLGDWQREGPFWLADVTIVLPTRRARLALAETFAQKLGGVALLPDIRTFGGEQKDEEPFLPPLDAPAALPQVGLLERRLVLADLIAAWAQTPGGREILAAPPSTPEILALADSLADVLDSLAIEGGDISRLEHLEEDLDLAGNWQHTRRFLALALEHWPQILASRGKADAAPLRNDRLHRQAVSAPLIYGDRPVIAAGSTGSIPATAALLAAIMKLPRGAIVLPGLDTTLSADEFAALHRDQDTPHGHPQYGLARLLAALKARPEAVIELGQGTHNRTLVVRNALALAEQTALWTTQRMQLAPQFEAATEDLAILAAPTADDEARAIALAARDALVRRRTVGIISPDRNLARRIAAELSRFDILVDDAAGTPLFHSPAGRLARQVLNLAAGDFAPVDLMALLRNRATTLGLERAVVTRLADALELKLLRGHLLRPGLDGLRRALAANLAGAEEFKYSRISGNDGAAIGDLLARLDDALAPLRAVLAAPGLRASDFASALIAAVSTAAPEPVGGGPEFTAWAAELASQSGEGPAIPPIALDAVLACLMAGFEVRNTTPRRGDIHIWGQLEARLQSPGLMVLAGLNEDIWPAAADPGPWLNRAMRLAIGLEPPERQQGLAAHDFMMALGNGEVIAAFAERIGTSPASPSRLLQRLEAFLGEDSAGAARKRGAHWIAEARRLDATGVRPKAAPRPMPRPPAGVRPRQLSFTEIEKLYRSPYDIYAKHVLKLSALPPLGEVPGGRERGSLIHQVFGDFIAGRHPFDAAAQARLEAMARDAFSGLDSIADRRTIWERRFAVAARLFIEFERERAPRIAERHAEIYGRWEFPIGFTLTGRADRVDVTTVGTIEIIDFKTGGVPEPKAMRNFEAPQLLLEAAMAQGNGIGTIAAATVSALTYVKIGSGAAAYRPRPFTPRNDDLAAAITEAEVRLQRHIQEFLLKDELPMTARIVPDAKQRFRGEFDHLARTEEWLVQEDEDF